MHVTETSAEGLKREFTVVVPAADFESRMSDRLAEIGRSVRIPGFRPGKVPASLLRKRYGDAVKGEVLERTVQESWQQALDDKGVRPAADPKVEIVKFEDGADLELKLAVEVLPEIEAIDFGTLELERLVAKPSDKEVDDALARMAEGRKSFAVAEGRAAQSGDQVVIDFTGRIDGEEFAGGSMTDFELEIGQAGFLPGFAEQIEGAKAGETRPVRVAVPDDHPNDQLRGKEIAFDVTVKEVRAPGTTSIDDEFAKSAGLESLDALKAAIRDQMEREYAQASRMSLKRRLLDRLSDAYDFEVPAGIVDTEFEGIWKQVEEAREKDQLDEDDKGRSEDELKERYRGIAERRVRLGLLLAEIGRSNNITVTQDDLNRAMHQEASRFPGQEARIIEYFQKNPEAVRDIQAPIYEEKVVDFIIEMAKVTDREVPVEDLFRDPDEDGAPEAEAKGSGKGKAKAAAKSPGEAKGKARASAKSKSADEA
jgi:trigger factor